MDEEIWDSAVSRLVYTNEPSFLESDDPSKEVVIFSLFVVQDVQLHSTAIVAPRWLHGVSSYQQFCRI